MKMAFKNSLLTLLAFAAVFAYAVAAYQRNRVWGTDVLLYEDVTQKSPQKPRDYINLAVAYHEGGLLDEALRSYAAAIALDASLSVKSYRNLGVLYLDKGEPDRAIALFSLALAINAGDHLAYANRGVALYQQGKYAAALEDFSRSLDYRPLPDTYVNRGEAYLRMNDRIRARRDFQTACEQDDQDACERLREFQGNDGASSLSQGSRMGR